MISSYFFVIRDMKLNQFFEDTFIFSLDIIFDYVPLLRLLIFIHYCKIFTYSRLGRSNEKIRSSLVKSKF